MCSFFHPEFPVRTMCCWMSAADAQGQWISLCVGRSRWSKLVSIYFNLYGYTCTYNSTFPSDLFWNRTLLQKTAALFEYKTYLFSNINTVKWTNETCGYRYQRWDFNATLLFMRNCLNKYLKGNTAICLQLKMLCLLFNRTRTNKMSFF